MTIVVISYVIEDWSTALNFAFEMVLYPITKML